MGTRHKKQEGQQVRLPILVQPLTCSFPWTPLSIPRLRPWQPRGAGALGVLPSPSEPGQQRLSPRPPICIPRFPAGVRPSIVLPWLGNPSPGRSPGALPLPVLGKGLRLRIFLPGTSGAKLFSCENETGAPDSPGKLLKDLFPVPASPVPCCDS